MKNNNHAANPDSTHAGNKLQKLRRNAGFTQEKAAEKISRSTRTIQRYEAGETQPDRPTLVKMLDCYNCEAAELLFPLAPSDEEIEGNDNA